MDILLLWEFLPELFFFLKYCEHDLTEIVLSVIGSFPLAISTISRRHQLRVYTTAFIPAKR